MQIASTGPLWNNVGGVPTFFMNFERLILGGQFILIFSLINNKNDDELHNYIRQMLHNNENKQ